MRQAAAIAARPAILGTRRYEISCSPQSQAARLALWGHYGGVAWGRAVRPVPVFDRCMCHVPCAMCHMHVHAPCADAYPCTCAYACACAMCICHLNVPCACECVCAPAHSTAAAAQRRRVWSSALRSAPRASGRWEGSMVGGERESNEWSMVGGERESNER